MIFDALNRENKMLKILNAIEEKKDNCRTGEALGILEDLEYELDQELKSVQAWLEADDRGEG